MAEIRDAIARLDHLDWETAELTEADAAARDHIARQQSFYAHLLAHVRGRYLPEVRRGLHSPQEETRRWVGLALAMRDMAPVQAGGTAPT